MKMFLKKTLRAITMLILLTAMSHNTLLAQPDGNGVWRYNATLEDYDLDELCPINVLNCWECDNSYMLVAEHYCSDPNYVIPEMVNAVKNWMSYIPDQTPLNKMSIPGTHDSGAERWEYCGGPISNPVDWSIITQSFSIAEQLKMGIRYFDIRVGETGFFEWGIFHGDNFLDLTFEQVLAQMNNFLEDHPSEGIIMSIQKEIEEDGEIGIVLGQYMKSDLGVKLWHPNPGGSTSFPAIPTMGELRNKIMIVRNGYGSGNWDPVALQMDTENHYKVWDVPGDVVDDSETATLTAKKRLVIDNIKKAHNPAQENWIVTYLSGATHMPIGCVSARTNDVAFQYLNELPSKTNVGTVLMDFPGYGLVYRIIKTNFVYDKMVDLTVAIDCHHSLLVGGASDSRINVKLYNGPYLIGEDTHVAGCSGLGDSFYQIKAITRAMPQDYTHITVHNVNPEEGDGLGIDYIYISRTKYGIGGVDGLAEDELIEQWGEQGGKLWCLGTNDDDEYGSDAVGTCNTYYSFFSGNTTGYPGLGAAPSKFISELKFYTQGCIPLENQAYTVKTQANPPQLIALCGPDAPPIIIKNDTTFLSNFDLPSQGTMIINPGVVLNIPLGVTLNMGSKSKLENHGTIMNQGKIIVHSTATVDNKAYATINSPGQYFNFGKTNNAGEIFNPVGYYGQGQGGKQTLINPVVAGYLLPTNREGGAIICENLGGSWESQYNTCRIDNYQVKMDYTLLVDSAVTLAVNGILTNNGTIENRGRIDNIKGTVNNCNIYLGKLPTPNSVLDPCQISDDAIICGNLGGEWDVDLQTCNLNNLTTIDAASPLIISPGVTYNINNTLINEGTIVNSGTITNYGLIENPLDATIENYGTFTMEYEGSSGIGSTMANEGEVRNYGTFNNIYDTNGGITGCGTFDNVCGAVFTGVTLEEGCGIFYNEAWPELVPPQAYARDITIRAGCFRKCIHYTGRCG